MNDKTMFSLAGATGLVTGAAGHLGREMSAALAQAGATVLLNGRDEARILKLRDEFIRNGWHAEAAIFDVSDNESVARYFEERGNLPLHVIVNNAYAGGAGSIVDSATDDYLDSYNICVVAAHRLLQCALPSLRLAVKDSGSASVINIASMYGVVSPDITLYSSSRSANPPFYGAAKAALLQWTRYAACEFGHEGIRFNAVSPGPFPSPAVSDSNPAFVDRLADRVPLGRIGAAEEVRGPVLFLASSASSYVNGANLVVDGGWTCW